MLHRTLIDLEKQSKSNLNAKSDLLFGSKKEMLTYKTEYSGTYRMVKDDQEELEAYQKEYYTREFIITVILIY